MKKRILGLIALIGCLNAIPSVWAESAIAVYNMPSTIRSQLKIATQQSSRGECEQKKRTLDNTAFYAFHDKLLILIGLPDYFCSTASFMPVTVDRQGHWETGAVMEGNPSMLLTDTAQRLWLVSHFEIEAVFPMLHQSRDGVHWQAINLPKKRGIACCFEYLKNLCVSGSQLELKFTGLDEAEVEYWQTPVRESVRPNPPWQKVTASSVKKANQCQTVPLTRGDWQRNLSKNGAEMVFSSASQQTTVILPHWLD